MPPEAAPEPVAPADPLATLAEPSVLGAAAPAAPPAGEGAAPPEGSAEPQAEGDKPAVPLAGAPEAYELKMPEGVTLNEEAWKAAEPAFRAANIGPEQAQKLAEAFPGIVEAATKAAANAPLEQAASIRKEWATEWKADPVIGGANYDKSLTTIAAGRDALLTSPADRQFFEDTGLGNSPVIGRLFYNAGLRLSEGAVHQPAPRPDSGAIA